MGTSELARIKRRKQAAIVREDLAITLFARGLKVEPDICDEMRRTFGIAASGGTVREIIRRGLARRAANAPEGTEEARELMMEGYRQILQAHMALAVGNGADPPSVRSADIAMRALDKMAELLGVRRVPDNPVGGLNVQFNITTPEGIGSAREKIMASLAREAEKHGIVEGHLASVGTSRAELTSGEPDDDTLGPPPGVIPTQEEAA